jgi:hypothetical protein
VHAEGERVILKREGQQREEVDLTSPEAAAVPLVSGSPEDRRGADLPLPVCPDGSPQGEVLPEAEEQPSPGASPLDAALRRMDEAIGTPPPATAEGGSP